MRPSPEDTDAVELIHLGLGNLTGQLQVLRSGPDPLTRRHPLNGVVVAQLPVGITQLVTGGHLVGVVPVPIACRELVDGHHDAPILPHSLL